MSDQATVQTRRQDVGWRRAHRVSIALSADEHKRFMGAARRMGKSLSLYLYEMLVRKTKESK